MTPAQKKKIDAVHEAHCREQQLYWATRPFWEKLRWLEEAHHMVLHMQKQHAARMNQMNQRRHEQSGDEHKG